MTTRSAPAACSGGPALLIDHHDEAEAARAAGQHAVVRRLEERCPPGVDAEAATGRDVHVRCGLASKVLAVGDVAVDARVDQRDQVRPLEQRLRIGAPRDHGAGQARVAHELEVEASAVERANPVLLEALEEHRILAVGEPVHRVALGRVIDAALGQADPPALEKGAHRILSGSAVHQLRVVDPAAECGKRHTRLLDAARDEPVEHLAPHLRVQRRAGDEDAVDVEDTCLDGGRHVEQLPRLDRRPEQTHESWPRVAIVSEGAEHPDQVGPLVREPARPGLERRTGHVAIAARREQRRLCGLEGSAPRADQRVDVDVGVRHGTSLRCTRSGGARSTRGEPLRVATADGIEVVGTTESPRPFTDVAVRPAVLVSWERSSCRRRL